VCWELPRLVTRWKLHSKKHMPRWIELTLAASNSVEILAHHRSVLMLQVFS
jgi:hypothetical protein